MCCVIYTKSYLNYIIRKLKAIIAYLSLIIRKIFSYLLTFLNIYYVYVASNFLKAIRLKNIRERSYMGNTC